MHSINKGAVEDDDSKPKPRFIDRFWPPARWTPVVVLVLFEYIAYTLALTVLPALQQKEFGKNEFLVVGVSSGIAGFLSFIGTPSIGRISDRIGRKGPLMLTTFTTLLPLSVLAFYRNLFVYQVLSAAVGFTTATFSLAFAIVSDVTDEKNRSAGLGTVVAMFGVSFVAGPFLSILLTSIGGLSAALYTVVGMLVFNLLFTVFCVPETRVDESAEPVGEGEPLPTVGFCGRNRRKAVQPCVLSDFNPLRTFTPFWQSRSLMYLGLISFFSNLSEQGLVALILQFLQSRLGFTPLNITEFAIAFGLLMALSQSFLLPFVLRFVSTKTVIVCSCILNAIHVSLYGFANQKWEAFGILALACVSFLAFPSIAKYATVVTPKRAQGQVLGALTGVRALTSGIGPIIFGTVLTATCPVPTDFSNYYCGTAFLIGACCVLTSAAIAYFLLPAEEDAAELIKETVREALSQPDDPGTPKLSMPLLREQDP